MLSLFLLHIKINFFVLKNVGYFLHSPKKISLMQKVVFTPSKLLFTVFLSCFFILHTFAQTEKEKVTKETTITITILKTNNKISPTYLESCILQYYFNETDTLPIWNNSF